MTTAVITAPSPPLPSARLTGLAAAARWAEMLGLFFGVPAVIAAFVDPARRFDGWFRAVGLGGVLDLGWPRARVLMPALAIFTLVILGWLLLDRSFPKRNLWNGRETRAEMRRILGLFAVGAALLFGLAFVLDGFTPYLRRADGASAFLWLPMNAPWALVFIAIGYPWFSCYPQEITHRAFFFHRYRPIVPGRWAMIGVNAVAFCWLHAPFWNAIALALTLPAGVLFAWTYDRTRSTLAVTVEHALYGWWVFFTGLGWFVYAGSLGG